MEKSKKEKDIKIKLLSRVSSPDEEGEKIEFFTDGKMERNGSDYILTYRESEALGMDGNTTHILFDTGNRDVLTMTRGGSDSALLVFDNNNRRQMCVYNAGSIPFEICLLTRNVKNSVGEDGGTINLDYSIEIRGSNARRAQLTIDVTV